MRDGDQLGRYRLLRVIGTGAFATVWLAADPELERYVAIKVLADNLSRSADARRRFTAEAEALLTVESPRVVRGYELGTSPDDRPYLVMSLADRGTLEERMKARRGEQRRWTVTESCAIAAEISRAVADVHRFGHLHRDIKPSNVLIRSTTHGCGVAGLAPDECLQLADFGLVRSADASALTLVAGTPGYVSPEQASGLLNLDERSDVFSVGQILVELLTGRPASAATTMSAAATARPDAARLLAAVDDAPADLVEVTERALAADRDRRTASAAVLAAELDRFRSASGQPLRRRRRRPWWAIAAVLLAVLSAAGVLAWTAIGGDDPPPTTVDTTSHRFEIPATWNRDEARSTDTVQHYTVALSVSEVLDFFAAARGWRRPPTPTTASDQLILVRGGTTATITATPAAITAGDGITAVEVGYADASAG